MMSILFIIPFLVPFFMFWVIFFIIFKQILKSSNEVNKQAKDIFVKVKETTTTVDKNTGECVNDFDNTCEHVHLSNEIKEEDRYKFEDDVVIGEGPIDTDTSSDPIRRE